MKTELVKLIESIDPSRTYEETARRAAEAINAFAAPGHVADWEAFKKLIVKFVEHVEAHCLRLRRPFESNVYDFEEKWSLRMKLLVKAFGAEGEKTAFHMARTGNEGGLYRVLREVAKTMAEEYAENEIAGRVGAYWEGLSAEEQLAAGEEYVKLYGHLIPSEVRDGSAPRIRGFLWKVLREHPKVIRKLSEAVRA